MNIKRISALLVMLIIVVPCVSWAGEDVTDPIDKRLEECIEKNPTTAGMTNCAYESMDAWDKEMNVVYKKLMKRLDTKGKTALKKSQIQWLKFRDDEFEFIAAYYDNFQGTMYIPMRANAMAQVVKERTIKLRSYLNLLDMR